MLFWIGQGIGFVGVIISFIIFQQKNKNKMILCKLLSDVIWALHYGFIGAYSGMAVALVNIPREVVYYCQNKNKNNSPISLVVFGIINVIFAIITWKNVFSLFPTFASISAMFAFWLNNVKATKKISLLVSVLMLTYDIFNSSYMGILNEIITLISIIVALTVLLRNKKEISEAKKEKENE